MKKIMNAMLGGANADKPAKKATVYAIFATTAVLLLTVLILIVSSIVFALGGEEEASLPNDNANAGDSIGTAITIEYTTISAPDLENKIEGAVSIRENRSDFGVEKNYYYASSSNSVKLCKSAQKALDSMLLAFYNANKTSIITDANNAECNIPLVASSDGAYVCVINTYDEQPIEGDAFYSWIYTNAYKYGFVYEGNSFRYVGTASSNYMKSNNMTYSDYMSLIKNATSNISATATDMSTNRSVKYQIYYLAGTSELKVPTNYEYTVIGNSTDGYIITVNVAAKTN